MGGTINYVHRDGSRLTPWMLYVINRANVEFKARFGCELLVTSGIRTNQEQRDIFLSKFRVEWFGNGPYGDVRWWQGKRYVRHAGGGTVAAPGTSNHEVQGSKAAVDLRDSGRDAGVATGGNARANWLRANASRLGLIPSGYGFGEPWHYDIPDIFRTPPTTPAGGNSRPVPTPSKPAVVPEEEEDEMKNSGVYYEPSKGSVTYLLFNTGSGWYHEFSNGAGNGPMPGDYNNALAGTLGTGSWAKITPGHAAVIKTSLDAVRAQSKS